MFIARSNSILYQKWFVVLNSGNYVHSFTSSCGNLEFSCGNQKENIIRIINLYDFMQCNIESTTTSKKIKISK